MKPVLLGLSVVCTFWVGVAAQSPVLSTLAALDRYAQGERDVIRLYAPDRLPPLWTIAANLDRVRKPVQLTGAGFEESPRALAAFAVEAARILETQSSTSACALITATRVKWLTGESEFNRRWFTAAIATLLRNGCSDDLEKTAAVAIAAFPTEASFRLARLVAAEQRLTVTFDNGDRPLARDLRDAETRFKIAEALPPSRAEAALHWSRINARLGQHDQAIVFAAEASASVDPAVRYLAHLFRGWSLAALDRVDEAEAEYRQALSVVPDAQTATLAMATLAFKSRKVDRAEEIVKAVVSRRTPVDDPWWTYSIGDGRLVDQRIIQMRQVIR